MSTEENYNKILKENHTIKQEYKETREKLQGVSLNNNNNSNNNTNINDIKQVKDNHYYKGVKTSSNNILNSFENSKNSNLNQLSSKYQIIQTQESNLQHGNITNKMEYLKNVLLKYLEAIAQGDQFQIRILENVIFSVLGVTQREKNSLDDKRLKSSFYYSLWYNTKNFISSKIYGTAYDDSYTPSSTRSNKLGSIQYEESKINTEMNITNNLNNSDEKNNSYINSRFDKNNAFSELNSFSNSQLNKKDVFHY